MTTHVLETHATADECHPREGECMICDGGLALCTVCNGGEASLPTDCPGAKMTAEQQRAVANCEIDYQAGRGWGLARGGAALLPPEGR